MENLDSSITNSQGTGGSLKSARPWFNIICMSTVLEMKQAFIRLPERQRVRFARWLQTQVDDRLSDDEMMAVAAEGARALDRREARLARRKAR